MGDVKAQQEFNNRQVYPVGFTFGCAAGPANEFPIILGGQTRQLHGLIIFAPTAFVNEDDTISLLINNETVISKVNWKAYSPASSGNTFKPNQYFKLKRALSGRDGITLTVNAISAHNIFPIFYVSDSHLAETP